MILVNPYKQFHPNSHSRSLQLPAYHGTSAPQHLSKLRSDGDVLLPTRLGEPLHIGCLAEQQTMRRATKVEHANLFALFDMLPSVDGDITRADLDHPNSDERHQPDRGVVRLDEDDRAGGDGGDVSLARDGTCDFNVIAMVGRIVEALEERLGVVRAVVDERFDYRSRYGRVPAVVRECGEERLVYGTALELGCEVVKREHVEDRVLLALEPELVPQTAVIRYVVALRFACVGDDRVVIGRGDGAHTVSESAREEVVPGRVAVVRFRWVTVEDLLKGVRVPGRVVRNGRYVGSTMRAEPPTVVITEALLRRRFRFEEVPPDVEDLLEHRVDLRVEEEREATGGPHRPVKRGADGHAYHSDPLRFVGPRWTRGDQVVKDLEEVGVIPNLHVTSRVRGVWLLVRHLVEHGRDEAEYSRVCLDELLELFEDGMEGRWILIDVVDDTF